MNSPTYAEPVTHEPEIALVGGTVTEGVVRKGDTVRRPLGRHSPLVHALLRHLESVGFEGAPRFLGIDSAGREVLTFVAGEVAGQPRHAWVTDENRLASVGRLVRAYDDAIVGFTVPEDIEPPAADVKPPPDMPPAPPYPPEFIGHMDLTPDNVVFRDGEAVSLIDFDLARPASRVDEVHNLMLHWAPLGDPADADPPLDEVDVPRRCRIIADAYGMSEADRGRLVEVALLRSRRAWFAMRQIAEVRGGGWARMWEEGIGDKIKRRQAWLEHNGPAIDAALTATHAAKIV